LRPRHGDRESRPATGNILGPHTATDGGQERIERKPDGVHVYMTQVRSHFTPDIIRVKQGDTVVIHVTSVEQTRDATHGFAIADYNIQASVEPGETTNFEFVADKPGAFNLYCTEFCSALHLEMAGWVLVEPSAAAAIPGGASAPADAATVQHQH